jgi:hypothetical protein
MSTSAIIVVIVVIAVFAVAMVAAAILERRRGREVLGDERARGRNPDVDRGPDRGGGRHL